MHSRSQHYEQALAAETVVVFSSLLTCVDMLKVRLTSLADGYQLQGLDKKRISDSGAASQCLGSGKNM